MSISRNKFLLPLTAAEIRAAAELVRVREALERIDKKLEAELRPKGKKKKQNPKK